MDDYFVTDLGHMASVLHEVSLPIIESQMCSSMTVYGKMFTDTMICAGFLNGGVDTCQVIYLTK